MAIDLHRCTSCGALAHPPRALCPLCGGAEWRVAPCETGIVEECTIVAGPDPVVLASVRVADGPVVVAALPGRAAVGAVVALRPGPGRSVHALTFSAPSP